MPVQLVSLSSSPQDALVSTSNNWSLSSPDFCMGSEVQIPILILVEHVLCPSTQLLGLFTIFSFRDFSYVWYYSVTFITKFLHSLIFLFLEVLEVFFMFLFHHPLSSMVSSAICFQKQSSVLSQRT